MKKKTFFILILYCVILPVLGQRASISGTVLSKEGNEKIAFAYLIDSLSQQGIEANEYGYFSIMLDTGEVTLICSYAGYTPKIIVFNLQKDTIFDISLENFALSDIVIQDAYNTAKNVQVSRLSIPIYQLKNIPVLGGEGDILKSLQLLPGIQSGQEGTSNLYVRGGSPDQNLILLDEVPIYNVNHLFGFFSLFPSGAIKNVDVWKGGFPAKYGGKLSSVIEVKSKEGNMLKREGNISFSPIALSACLEGPILKDKISYFISARRTLWDLISLPATSNIYKKLGGKGFSYYYFYDLIAKVNGRINDKNHLYLSFYSGYDKSNNTFSSSYQIDSIIYTQKNQNNMGWGNITCAIRWNQIVSEKIFANLSVAYTQYQMATKSDTYLTTTEKRVETTDYTFGYKYYSKIKDVIAKYEWQYYHSTKHEINAGLQSSFKWFTPGIGLYAIDNNQSKIDTTIGNKNYNANNLATYIEDKWMINDKIQSFLGLRGEWIQASKYLRFFLQPRISTQISINDKQSLKLAYSYTTQSLHLLTNSSVGLPTDIWVPVTGIIPPATSHQIVLGYFWDVTPNVLFSIETYYKKMSNVIEYKSGASYLNSLTDWQDKVALGVGEVLGCELFLHKQTGKLNGWLSYSLSYNNRKFPDLNNGQPFPYKYDRRHIANIFVNYDIQKTEKKTRSLSTTWTFASGSAITIPNQIYSQNPNTFWGGYETILQNFPLGTYFPIEAGIVYSPQVNNYRMRPFHKLDIGFSSTKHKKQGKRIWSYGIYNIYGRKNPYFISYKNVYDTNALKWVNKYFEISYFAWIPYISF